MFCLRCCSSFSENESENPFVFSKETSDKATAGNSENIVETSIKSKTVDVTDFTFMQVLDRGSFGKVILAKNNKSNDIRAVKVINKYKVIEERRAKYVMAERNAMILSGKHPFITETFSCFQTKDYLFFEMEFVSGGNLLFHLNRSLRFNEKTVSFYAAEIIVALQFLHGKNILHRDLKLENILLDSQGHCKLTDFGLCKEISNGASTSTICGTHENIAPEIIQGKKYGKSSDWWALGVLIFRMSSGYQPFAGEELIDLYHSIVNDGILYPIYFGNLTIDIEIGLMMKDPKERLGCSENNSEIRRHRLFRHLDWEALELLQIDPPFVPTIASNTDTSNFNTKYTKLNPVLDRISNDKKFVFIQLSGFYYEKPEEIDEQAKNSQ